MDILWQEFYIVDIVDKSTANVWCCDVSIDQWGM